MSNFTNDLHKHKLILRGVLYNLANQLKERADNHDNSKYYNCTKPLIQKALDHHYAKNRHHPEHFEHGVEDMNLLDILEMVVDWDSSASCRGTELDTDYSFKRFKITPQLQKIILNTLKILYDEDKK